jgi:hypothetical protein
MYFGRLNNIRPPNFKINSKEFRQQEQIKKFDL